MPVCGASWRWDGRKGRIGILPTLAKKAKDRVKTLRERSFSVAGPRIFNSLPRSLRDMSGCTKEIWKKNLDSFLENIPDTPCLGYEYTSENCNVHSAKPSNSVCDWITRLRLNSRVFVEDETVYDTDMGTEHTMHSEYLMLEWSEYNAQ